MLQMIQGSLEPALRVALSGDDGEALDLSAAAGVLVRGTLHGVEVFSAALAGPYGADGVVEREWEAGETDEPGRLWVDVRVTWPGSRIQWFRPVDVVDVEPLG